MRSWSNFFITFSITLSGFLLGVVLVGIGGISAKTTIFFKQDQVNKNESPKNIEEYWQSVNLMEEDLFEFISNKKCHSSEKYFLSCINATLSILAEQKNTISSTTGFVESINSIYDRTDMSEKEILTPYLQMYSLNLNYLVDFDQVLNSFFLTQSKNKDKTSKDLFLKSKSHFIANAINKFYSVYKDPHTYILPENYYEEVGSQLERSFLFVGLTFEKLINTNTNTNTKNKNEIRIRKVFKNSDAEHAGLKEFDQLIKIDSQDVSAFNLHELSKILKNSEKKSFVFEVIRDNQNLIIPLNRSFNKLSHVQFESIQMANKKLGVLTITKFTRGVCEDIATRLKNYMQVNEMLSGLVLDLRDNPGGQLDEAACLAGLFLGMNKKTYTVNYLDPIKSNEVVLSSGSMLYNGPLVVLVNSLSASASELLSGALQDYKRALIVGERTFGKGTFQESEPWNKKSKTTLFKTQGFYLLPSNRSPQLLGIQPDFEIIENHKKIREEDAFINPLNYLPNEKFSSRKLNESYVEYLNGCFKKSFKNEFENLKFNSDQALTKAIEILNCQKVTTALSQDFSPSEYN